MSANITRNGKSIRPSFLFQQGSAPPWPLDSVSAQLLESLRNLTESELDRQLGALRRIVQLLEMANAVLLRIDGRLAKGDDLPIKRKRSK